MLYATDTLLPILFYFLTIPFTILSIALKKKRPFMVYKKGTANIAINSQTQQPSYDFEPFYC